jgi:hypothetical protein
MMAGGVRATLRTDRAAARVAGILFLVSYASFTVGTVLVEPMRAIDADLLGIHTQSGQLVVGLLLEFVNVAAVIGFAVVLLPYLRRGGEALAHGYVAMRVLEGSVLLIAGVATASLITLSEQAAAADGADGAAYRAAQVAAVGQSIGAETFAVAAFVVGATLLYLLLYRTRLVPRFVAVWGLVAAGLLVVLNLMGADVTELGPAALLAVPIIANEVFLAIWLIVRGFSPAIGRSTPTAPAEPIPSVA